MSKYTIYQGKDQGDQNWRWRLTGNNHEPIARSEEPFASESNVRESIEKIRDNVTLDTPICEEGSVPHGEYGFEIFEGAGEHPWYWRLRAGNREIMAVGGEGFPSRSNAERSVEKVRDEMGWCVAIETE